MAAPADSHHEAAGMAAAQVLTFVCFQDALHGCAALFHQRPYHVDLLVGQQISDPNKAATPLPGCEKLHGCAVVFEKAVDHRVGDAPILLVDVDNLLPHHHSTGERDSPNIPLKMSIDQYPGEQLVSGTYIAQCAPSARDGYLNNCFVMNRRHDGSPWR